MIDYEMNEYERKKAAILDIELKNSCLLNEWSYHSQLMFLLRFSLFFIKLEMVFNVMFLLFYKLVFIRRKSRLVPLLLAIES